VDGWPLRHSSYFIFITTFTIIIIIIISKL
jgi:hypothetical protein